MAAQSDDLDAITIAGRAVFGIHGMWCTSCAMALQRAMSRVPGIRSATVNFTSASAMLTWDPDKTDLNLLKTRVHNLGYELILNTDEDATQTALNKQSRRIYIQLSIAVVFGMWSMLGSWVIYLSNDITELHYWLAILAFVLSLPVVLYSGLDFYRAAIKTLRVGIAGMDAMISLGVWGSVLISLWHLIEGQTDIYIDAATMLITFLLVGRLIEIKARQESRLAVDALRKLAPETITRLEQGKETTIHAHDVRVQDLVLIRSGERIAVDGVIEAGQSQINSALLTGESYPTSVAPGSPIYAGAINITAPIHVRVDKAYGKRRIDLLGLRMLELFGNRSTLAKTAETFIRILFPATVILAILAFIYYNVIGFPIDRATLGALSILVAACPCAVGLALPLAYALGCRKAAQAGILWRDPASVENLAQAQIIAFDKTGTLTTGSLAVEKVVVAHGWDSQSLLQQVALAEAGVAHPIAQAIRQAANLSVGDEDVLPQTTIAAQGVTMTQPDGQILMVGSHKWLKEHQIRNLPDITPSVVYVADGTQWIGSLYLRDQIQPNLAAFLSRLKSHYKLILWLISGDSLAATKQLTGTLDVEFDKIEAQKTPEEKAALLHSAPQRPIAFVGDGANDALVLASADCGIVIPGASSVAVAAAGMVITKGGIDQVERSLSLAKRYHRIVRQNLFFSIVYNIVIIAVLFASGVTPFAAAIAMLLSSCTVLLNTTRLL